MWLLSGRSHGFSTFLKVVHGPLAGFSKASYGFLTSLYTFPSLTRASRGFLKGM